MLRRIAFATAAPLGAFVLTLIVSSIALLLFGSNPIDAFSEMLGQASRLETQVAILNRATPLYLSAVAAAIGFRMNLFNIGVEGQYLFAFIIAAQVGSLISAPPILHIPIILIVAMVTGGLFSGIAGVLKVTRGVNEVISTIMLNSIAVAGLIAALQARWQPEQENFTSTTLGTAPIDETGLIPNINGLVEIFTREIRQGGELTGMFLIAIAVGVIYHLLLTRMRFGFDLRASGLNPFAARAGGIPPKRMIVLAMVLSGAVAGLIGMVELADEGKFPPDPIQGLGFAGIAVALLGRNNPGGMAFSALLFAFLDVSAGVLQATGTATKEIVNIMQGIVLLAAVIAYGIAKRVQAREEARATAEALREAEGIDETEPETAGAAS